MTSATFAQTLKNKINAKLDISNPELSRVSNDIVLKNNILFQHILENSVIFLCICVQKIMLL